MVLALDRIISWALAQSHCPDFTLDKKISVPGNGGYDYMKIDTNSNRLFISHGTNVTVIDIQTEAIIGTIDHMTGVHGIAIAPEFQKGFISDGKANAVVVFDLQSSESDQDDSHQRKGSRCHHV